MSNWALKSEESFKSANKLITEHLYNASVHSSYYSCVQYLLHVMSSHYGLEDKEINNLHQQSSQSTHKYLRNEIFKSLRTLNPDYAVDFNDDIGELCSRRNVADYRSEIIDPDEAKDIRQLAYNTLKMLKASYS